MPQRQTRQRAAIREVLERSRRPLSVDEILAGARSRVASINLATVYRNLRRLLDEETVRPVELAGQPARYEIAFSTKSHHHHFHCEQCDRMFDVTGCPPGLSELVPPDFQMTGHDIILYGTCKDCDDPDEARSKNEPGRSSA